MIPPATRAPLGLSKTSACATFVRGLACSLWMATTCLMALAVPAQAKKPDVLIVTKNPVPYAHYTTIQTAVDDATPGDWVLIDRGAYPEPVHVTTPGIHIRGIDRNDVVVDGEHDPGPDGRDGIVVFKANNVSIENLTVRNFDRATLDGEGGNEIWWNGGDGSGQIGLRGWYGRYLTAYDDGLLGGYGIFAVNSIKGSWDHVYASGFNDSGLYIGACRECRAQISDALVENNALGYSGTNSGGHIVIEDSIFRHNSNGIGPNSLNNDDQPPPQDGACDSFKNRSPTPTFDSTHIARCTIFRDNLLEANDNLNAPANSTAAQAPWGNGVVLIGTYADRVTNNVIRDNPSTGLLGFENPDPFPPTPDTVYFQLAGNRVDSNLFVGNGASGPFAGDITLEGGLFGQQLSTNNCLADNVFQKSWPPNIEGTWGCQNDTTPNPGGLAIFRILLLQQQSLSRHSVPQPPPPAQPTMPDPCKGVPRNPLCE